MSLEDEMMDDYNYDDDTDNTDDETVVFKLNIIITKLKDENAFGGAFEKSIPFYIKYSSENLAYDSEACNFSKEKNLIEKNISSRFSGYTIQNIIPDGFSTCNFFYDIDQSIYNE